MRGGKKKTVNGRSISVNISGTSPSNSHFSSAGEKELVSLCWKELLRGLVMSVQVRLNPPLPSLLQLTASVPPRQAKVTHSSSSLLTLSPHASSNDLPSIFSRVLASLSLALRFSFDQPRVTGAAAGAKVCAGGLV